jgi:phosphate uptake regulator
MEIRRIQQTGGSSFIITLPKEWIKSVNLKKNDPIGIIIKPEGTLVLTPKLSRESEQTTKEFKVSDNTNKISLLRELIGAYISGYTYIEIRSHDRIPIKIRDTIRNYTNLTIGQEIIEETDNSIIVKDLLNPTEMPFERTIKRMYIITKGMLEDVLYYIETNDVNIIKDIEERDNDVDKLHWLVARQHNILTQNFSLSEKMNIKPGKSTTYFLISRIIERIGDHEVKIIKNIQKNPDQLIDKNILDKIQKAGKKSLDIFNKSINSFFKKDIKESNENIEAVYDLEEFCDEINSLALKQGGANSLTIGYITDSIRRIAEYSQDISENVINYLISSYSAKKLK